MTDLTASLNALIAKCDAYGSYTSDGITVYGTEVSPAVVRALAEVALAAADHDCRQAHSIEAFDSALTRLAAALEGR